MNFFTNNNTEPAERRSQCQAQGITIQTVDDDEELSTILSNAQPGTLDLPIFTDRLFPGNGYITIRPTLSSSQHHLKREESSNGKGRHRYPTVINDRAIFTAPESNFPPKKRHIDVSLEEKLPLKKRALKKRFFDCSVEENLPLKKRLLKKLRVEKKRPLKKRPLQKGFADYLVEEKLPVKNKLLKKNGYGCLVKEKLPLKKRLLKKSGYGCLLEDKLPLKKRLLKKSGYDCLVEEKLPLKKRWFAGNPIVTQTFVYAEQRANKALNLTIHPTSTTSMISESFLRKRALAILMIWKIAV